MLEKNILSVCGDFLFLPPQLVEAKDTAENKMWSHKESDSLKTQQRGAC